MDASLVETRKNSSQIMDEIYAMVRREYELRNSRGNGDGFYRDFPKLLREVDVERDKIAENPRHLVFSVFMLLIEMRELGFVDSFARRVDLETIGQDGLKWIKEEFDSVVSLIKHNSQNILTQIHEMVRHEKQGRKSLVSREDFQKDFRELLSKVDAKNSKIEENTNLHMYLTCLDLAEMLELDLLKEFLNVSQVDWYKKGQIESRVNAALSDARKESKQILSAIYAMVQYEYQERKEGRYREGFYSEFNDLLNRVDVKNAKMVENSKNHLLVTSLTLLNMREIGLSREFLIDKSDAKTIGEEGIERIEKRIDRVVALDISDKVINKIYDLVFEEREGVSEVNLDKIEEELELLGKNKIISDPESKLKDILIKLAESGEIEVAGFILEKCQDSLFKSEDMMALKENIELVDASENARHQLLISKNLDDLRQSLKVGNFREAKAAFDNLCNLNCDHYSILTASIKGFGSQEFPIEEKKEASIKTMFNLAKVLDIRARKVGSTENIKIEDAFAYAVKQFIKNPDNEIYEFLAIALVQTGKVEGLDDLSKFPEYERKSVNLQDLLLMREDEMRSRILSRMEEGGERASRDGIETRSSSRLAKDGRSAILT